MLLGEDMWLRPFRNNLKPLQKLTQKVQREDPYLEFMIHSSELMPGGSIYFKDVEAIERLYSIMDQYFAEIMQQGYCGVTLREYAQRYNRTS